MRRKVFILKIYERGNGYMNSLFMGKKTIKWLLYNLEEVVSDVNPKQFATTREDDIYIYIYI